ncbi:MAG: hypothetical protein PHG41_07450 [Actinomycetota bacterium]|nr:hypothetical protein [Actinomycetota bacterium]
MKKLIKIIYKFKRNKNIKKQIMASVTVLSCLFIMTLISGCTIFGLIKESFTGKPEMPVVPDIEIDDEEIDEIKKGDAERRKTYDIENEIILVDESLRNPFKPFYIQDEEEEEKNILRLDNIYTLDGVEYIEINLNNYNYKLKEGDTLSSTYLVQAINVNSAVLLKGDEILTLILDTPVYD